MKNSTKPFSLIIILLFALALVSCKDAKTLTVDIVPGKKQIVLLVDTQNLSPGDNPKDYCSFPDQQGAIEDYITDVLQGDSVVWIGVSSYAPTEDKVEIKQIIHLGGPNVLHPTQESKGKVLGKIKNNAPKEDEVYKIQFRVIKKGGQPNTYNLDPILRVH